MWEIARGRHRSNFGQHEAEGKPPDIGAAVDWMRHIRFDKHTVQEVRSTFPQSPGTRSQERRFLKDPMWTRIFGRTAGYMGGKVTGVPKKVFLFARVY